MRLYTFLHSPNPLKIRLALCELGLDCEQVEVRLFAGEHRSDWFTKLNPHQKVPVLEDGALVLPESGAILCYLGRREQRLWPADLAGEAQAYRWQSFVESSLANPCGTIWWHDTVSPQIGAPPTAEAVLDQAAEQLERALDVLEGHLGQDREHVLDPAGFTLVDCALGVSLAMLLRTRLDQPDRWPYVTAYRDRIMARPSWAAAQGNKIHSFNPASP